MSFHAIQLGRVGHKERIKAMRLGVASVGGTVIDCPYSDVATLEKLTTAHDVRFAYTCGMHWTERAARAFLESKGIPMVVLDLGYFKRAKNSADRVGYNQVGLGKIGWVPECEVDSSRWDALGIPDAVAPVTDRPRNVLVLGQVPNDSQHNMTEKVLNTWLNDQTEPFRANGYKITFRPHPLHAKGERPICDLVSVPKNCTLAESLAQCSHVVTFNSTAGLEAILAGVPVVCDESAHYYNVAGWGQCGNALPLTKSASHRVIMRHMHRLAWSQWTCAEIETGAPLHFLFPGLAPAPKPMKHLIAIPYFGTNSKYLEMLHEWVRTLKRTAPDAEFVIFTHDAADMLKPFDYPVLKLDISGYADVMRAGQPFDIKGALMCEAALAIDRPFLMLDSDALLIADPSAALGAMGNTPCAMPIDHGAILSGHQLLCDKPFAAVRKMCAGVFWFGDVTRRKALVGHYLMAWRELLSHNCPWTPCIPHLLEQYAWSLAHHRMNGATLPATMNWAPHIVGKSPHAIVNHLFGHKKWNGKAPANT